MLDFCCDSVTFTCCRFVFPLPRSWDLFVPLCIRGQLVLLTHYPFILCDTCSICSRVIGGYRNHCIILCTFRESWVKYFAVAFEFEYLPYDTVSWPQHIRYMCRSFSTYGQIKLTDLHIPLLTHLQVTHMAVVTHITFTTFYIFDNKLLSLTNAVYSLHSNQAFKIWILNLSYSNLLSWTISSSSISLSSSN